MQDRALLLAADAQVRDLATRRALALVAVPGLIATAGFVFLILLAAFLLTSETGTRALDMDYRVFWAAGRLALQGQFLAPFDMTALGAVHDVQPEEWMPWLYPPGYLLLIAPLGAPSFAVSFLIATGLSLGAMTLALRPFTGGSWAALLAFGLAPAYLPALMIGQNSLIWFAVLLAAMAALRSERWLLAGVLIGTLTLKPQLGLMIPFALLAAGLWRTILAAAITALLVAAGPTLVTGFAYWPLFLDRLGEQGDRLLSTIGGIELMVGPFDLLVRLGAPPQVALGAMGALAAASALVVVLAWRSALIGFDAKAAVLLTAMFLSAPYLWYYEAALMAPLGLFLLRAGILRPRLPDLALLAALWFGSGLQAMNLYVDLIPEAFPWAAVQTPVMLLCLALCLLHLWSVHRAIPAAA